MGIKWFRQLSSHLEALEKNPLPNSFSCWKNSVLCSCRTEVPISLPLSFYFYLFIYFLASPRVMWDLSSLTRVRTHDPCSGSRESQPLDCQGIPCLLAFRDCPLPSHENSSGAWGPLYPSNLSAFFFFFPH